MDCKIWAAFRLWSALSAESCKNAVSGASAAVLMHVSPYAIISGDNGLSEDAENCAGSEQSDVGIGWEIRSGDAFLELFGASGEESSDCVGVTAARPKANDTRLRNENGMGAWLARAR